jgi:GNAT superfamily N-acetyltransferase
MFLAPAVGTGETVPVGEPGAQGHGLGGALLAHTLRLADAAGEPAYLEASSTRSRVLYERHGFEVTGELSVDGSPPMWPMWRAPR